MKEISCCFTGHRIISGDKVNELGRKLENTINKLYADGFRVFISGAAVGFDLLASQAVIRCRNKNHDIKLVLAIPCSNQAEKWSKNNIEIYEKIKKLAIIQ